MFCGASWQVFWSTTDAARYQCYALSFWFGSNGTKLLPESQCAFLHLTTAQTPFHLLPVEYPPLTLAVFSLALLLPLMYYQVAFAVLMSLVSVLIYWLLLRYGPRGAALTFATYIFIGALATAQGRFDLIPATLTLLCVIAAERKHWTTAYVALAFGVLLKLYPLLLLPGLFIAEQQVAGRLHIPAKSLTLRALLSQLGYTARGITSWRWQNFLIFLGIILGVSGAFSLLNFQGAVVNQLSYFTQRPIQIEATASTVLWLAHNFDQPFQVVYSYGSLNSLSSLSGIVGVISIALLIAGYAYILWQQWRGKLDITQTMIAFLFIFIATGKVFSPQYLIWLIPLLAYAGAFDTFWLFCWGSVSVLTTFIYSYLYAHLSNPQLIYHIPGFFETIATRNAFFVLITLAYLFNWYQARQRKLLPPSPMGKETRPL
ncbi:MAG TPA: hypothetical protein VFB60_19845 [Ktedonobacteraceae bacterium]|nr:hypothetical protein [Ktedonobacteraceae bacterium]